LMMRRRTWYTLCPYTTLFRSRPHEAEDGSDVAIAVVERTRAERLGGLGPAVEQGEIAKPLHARLGHDLVQVGHTQMKMRMKRGRSEEHTSELQSRENLVCRLL